MTTAVRTVYLTPSQRRVYDVLCALGAGEELHNLGVSEAAALSAGWTSEVLHSLERMGLVRRRVARSRSDIHTRYVMWRRA